MAADAAEKVTTEHLRRAANLLGLEVSRLARNNADWHRLLEICALTTTLILDEDGLYDPCSFNDRLVLGLKGAMSEAELHLLKARLRGGQLAKARRGELAMPLPVGFVHDPVGRVVLDPDLGVQQAVRHLFSTFARTGSARATVKAFAEEGLLFPLRVRTGPNRGELGWHPLAHHRVLQVLHNPRYAGAFSYGRRHARRGKAPPCCRDWWSADAAGSMTVRYQQRGHDLTPVYVCQRTGIQTATPSCQAILGGGVDQAVSELLLATVTPMALEVDLAVSDELAAHAEEADRLRRAQVERARHTAELARRRYLAVDPDNRLVAASLEADWNQALRDHTRAQEDYERQAHAASTLSHDQRAKILALASDFPALWNDPRTPQRERKRMVRLLLADVTLL